MFSIQNSPRLSPQAVNHYCRNALGITYGSQVFEHKKTAKGIKPMTVF